MEQTIFEKIINHTIPAYIVYEDENTIAILDINPTQLGHTLVIPKKVSLNLIEMEPQLLGEYFVVVQKVARAIKESLGAKSCIFLLDGQEVPHTHTHIIPRYTKEHTSLDMNHHEKYSSEKEMEEYRDRISKYLN